MINSIKVIEGVCTTQILTISQYQRHKLTKGYTNFSFQLHFNEVLFSEGE